MSTELDVEFNLDETLTINCEVRDPGNGAMNLTGLTLTDIQWAIAAKKGGPALATRSIGTGITVTSAIGGLITIIFAPSAQDALHPPRTYWHECRVSHATHGVSIQFEGKAKVKESIFAVEA